MSNTLKNMYSISSAQTFDWINTALYFFLHCNNYGQKLMADSRLDASRS